MQILSNELVWWITVFDLPALGGLFSLVLRTKRESEAAVRRLREVVEARNSQMREALAAFKLEAAKTYAATGDLKDLETRLVGHLLRIESKLDATAMKTEALRGRHENETG